MVRTIVHWDLDDTAPQPVSIGDSMPIAATTDVFAGNFDNSNFDNK